jgi:hypothetical protein
MESTPLDFLTPTPVLTLGALRDFLKHYPLLEDDVIIALRVVNVYLGKAQVCHLPIVAMQPMEDMLGPGGMAIGRRVLELRTARPMREAPHLEPAIGDYDGLPAAIASLINDLARSTYHVGRDLRLRGAWKEGAYTVSVYRPLPTAISPVEVDMLQRAIAAEMYFSGTQPDPAEIEAAGPFIGTENGERVEGYRLTLPPKPAWKYRREKKPLQRGTGSIPRWGDEHPAAPR